MSLWRRFSFDESAAAPTQTAGGLKKLCCVIITFFLPLPISRRCGAATASLLAEPTFLMRHLPFIIMLLVPVEQTWEEKTIFDLKRSLRLGERRKVGKGWPEKRGTRSSSLEQSQKVRNSVTEWPKASERKSNWTFWSSFLGGRRRRRFFLLLSLSPSLHWLQLCTATHSHTHK